ncbi:hypothetical protein HAX54_000585, partial [Datura stramonium]|nr:hypothetical protein [Datura stramonium]
KGIGIHDHPTPCVPRATPCAEGLGTVRLPQLLQNLLRDANLRASFVNLVLPYMRF